MDKPDFLVEPWICWVYWDGLGCTWPPSTCQPGRNVQRCQTEHIFLDKADCRQNIWKVQGYHERGIVFRRLCVCVWFTWKLAMCSRSRGLLTDSSPEMGSMMKMPVGGWSAPGPVTLYLRERFLSWSDRICRGKDWVSFHSLLTFIWQKHLYPLFNHK